MSTALTDFAPRYLELLSSGEANPHPNIEVHNDRPAVALVDADRAPGPVALRTAADLAIDIAAMSGVGAVAVRRTVHTGAIGYYTKRIADAGMIGIAFVAGIPNWGTPGFAVRRWRRARSRSRCRVHRLCCWT